MNDAVRLHYFAQYYGAKAVPGKNPIELKGGMYTFMSLKLLTTDLQAIDKALASKVQQAPVFFKDTPVVVDLNELDAGELTTTDNFNAAELLDCIRRHQLQPIVASVSNKSSPLASAIALPLIEGSAKRQNTVEKSTSGQGSDARVETHPVKTAPDVELSLAASEVDFVVKVPMLINKPIRSGQQIYARDTDLIVVGQVGPGAEVIADNNIHVYGPLRGRALCGVSGNTATRIFCQSLEAELVSVAGNFRLLEEIPANLRGKPAQIWLENDRLNIEPL